jgi:hypothetical protein
MRRYLFVLCLMSAMAAIALAALPRSAAAIVCPLEPSSTPVCCGPPLAARDAGVLPICCGRIGVLPICCPDPLPRRFPCLLGVTIASTPNPSTTGQGVTVSGRVLGAASAATSVELWQELPGQKAFQMAAQTNGSAAGNYSFMRIARWNTEWYVTAGARRSAIDSQGVRALVALSGHVVRARRVQRIAVRGSVTPSHAGAQVLVEEAARGRWVIVARPRLGRFSRYRASVAFGRPGPARLRVVLPADAANVRSVSPVLIISASS